MPAFWGYPSPPHDYPYYWVILDPKWKEDKVKITNLKNLPKFYLFEFWNKLYMPHLLKLLDMMCKYEMDPMSIVEDTEQTRFCPQTDGQGETSKPLFQLCWSGGIIMINVTGKSVGYPQVNCWVHWITWIWSCYVSVALKCTQPQSPHTESLP